MGSNLTCQWINYYRNSLADGELLDIKAKDCEEGAIFNSIQEFNPGELSNLYQKFRKSVKSKKNQQFDEEELNLPINVFISPFYLSKEVIHASKAENKSVFPFWISAVLYENGELKTTPEETKPPWFIRSVLEPIGNVSGEYPIIGDLSKIDETLVSYVFDYESWKDYWQSSECFFQEVTGFAYKSFKIDGFVTINKLCIIKAKDIVTARNILKVYDDLQNEKKIPELFKNLFSFQRREKIPSDNELFLCRGHYGQYNNQFPLSNSQRKSLLIFEWEEKAKILAVNGPPGTGKTTLLQSIIANEVVKAALKGDQPPKIVASSTNNQAITNILDSFGSAKDNIERWLPNLSSLGSYLISSDGKKQQTALKKGYQILTRSNDNLEGFYFTNLHESDFDVLEDHFINCFNHHFENKEANSLDKIICSLKQNIINCTDKIDNVLSTVMEVGGAEIQYFPLNELDDFLESINFLKQNEILNEERRKALLIFRDNYNQFISKNSGQIFFGFIPPVKRSYLRKLTLFMVDGPLNISNDQISNKEVEETLLYSFNEIDQQNEQIHSDIQEKTKIYSYLSALKEKRYLINNDLEELWEIYLSSKKPKERQQIENEFEQLDYIEKINRILDISYRYSAFFNAVHYWEGQWVKKQQTEELKINKGSKSRENTFTRISYLTPLFISTFHSLPGFCSCYEKLPNGWIQKPVYSLFDILIVDEAGQVSPEVGAASFSLAKKALVVGDIYQIEPVWNISFEKIDVGNLQESGLLKKYEFDKLKESGVLCSSGSLMHLAQHASSVEVDSDLGGTLLTEHRRCVNELVEFSNLYVYKNMLQPMVGSSKGQLFKDKNNEIFIPPLSYIHIRGYSEKKAGSTYNETEAESIAKWIEKYSNSLSAHYKKELKDCIAVITPFAEQKNEIYRQFEKYKIDKEIIVGTVHALQGAEKPVIIFSPTYGLNHTSSQLFFDSGYNMLNVALTRAKQHFIVIGNMSLFNPFRAQKPSGGLAKILFADERNELSSSFHFSDKSVSIKNRVDTLERHQKCLKKAFEKAQKRIVIVSPFISIHAIRADHIAENIRKTIANGIQICIYTDKYLDMPDGKLKRQADEGRKELIESGAELKILNGIHNKSIAIDESVLIEGSFNWLSAVRDEKNPYYRYDASQIIMEEEAKKQISKLLNDLENIKRKNN